MNNNKTPESYGIIGLGRFGMSLAQELAQAGKDVLVIDEDESKVKEMREYTEQAFVCGKLTKEALEEAGIQNCDVVVVCIGERLDTSILTTLNVVSLGVSKVIAKATSTEQGIILEKLGAKVVYPERDMAVRLAKKLLSSSLLDYISLNNDIDVSEIQITDKLVGKSIDAVNFRKSFGLTIIAVEQGQETRTDVDPDYIFKKDDIVVVIGGSQQIRDFEKHMAKR
ncbi:potassium channel family protein [Bacilliculturomica massiliensis]|uniref:potassium channel family protein n=1 Tax=Bacilliculturomica massiliensis TaxID=1917867 RepID=UPI0010319AA6|nr:TrkA family potassium uptake protein [Bacilliculturomica massiliensis]